jgi:hypothetical protein
VNEAMKPNPRFTGLVQGTREIIKMEGIGGIYRGLFPVVSHISQSRYQRKYISSVKNWICFRKTNWMMTCVFCSDSIMIKRWCDKGRTRRSGFRPTALWKRWFKGTLARDSNCPVSWRLESEGLRELWRCIRRCHLSKHTRLLPGAKWKKKKIEGGRLWIVFWWMYGYVHLQCDQDANAITRSEEQVFQLVWLRVPDLQVWRNLEVLERHHSSTYSPQSEWRDSVHGLRKWLVLFLHNNRIKFRYDGSSSS